MKNSEASGCITAKYCIAMPMARFSANTEVAFERYIEDVSVSKMTIVSRRLAPRYAGSSEAWRLQLRRKQTSRFRFSASIRSRTVQLAPGLPESEVFDLASEGGFAYYPHARF